MENLRRRPGAKLGGGRFFRPCSLAAPVPLRPAGTLRVAALTRGRDVPSARFRVRQLVPLLAAEGVEVEEHAPARPAHRLLGRGAPGAYAHALLFRGAALAATRRADVTLLQRELVSTYRTLEGFAKGPRVLDVDDAVYLKRGGKAGDAVAAIARGCRMVLAGNRTLAEWFRPHCADVRIVPTAVDTDRYAPAEATEAERAKEASGGPVLGWIGTAANAGNLVAIQDALADTLERHPAARLRVVAERPPDLPALPPNQWEFVPWSAEREVALLRSFTVGLMPLEDTAWNRGKCGFKLLQYMAVGAPAVASPVGVNQDILAQGAGLAATTRDEWAEALDRLLSDAALRARMARDGRRVVVAGYGAKAVAPMVAKALRDAATA